MMEAVYDELMGKWFVVPPGYAPVAGPFDTEEDALDYIEDWDEML